MQLWLIWPCAHTNRLRVAVTWLSSRFEPTINGIQTLAQHLNSACCTPAPVIFGIFGKTKMYFYKIQLPFDLFCLQKDSRSNITYLREFNFPMKCLLFKDTLSTFDKLFNLKFSLIYCIECKVVFDNLHKSYDIINI